jgi:hypothetical protein
MLSVTCRVSHWYEDDFNTREVLILLHAKGLIDEMVTFDKP